MSTDVWMSFAQALLPIWACFAVAFSTFVTVGAQETWQGPIPGQNLVSQKQQGLFLCFFGSTGYSPFYFSILMSDPSDPSDFGQAQLDRCEAFAIIASTQAQL